MDAMLQLTRSFFEQGRQTQPIDTRTGWLDQRTIVNSEGQVNGQRLATMETSWDYWLNVAYNPADAILNNPNADAIIMEHPVAWPCFQKRAFAVANCPLIFSASDMPGADHAESQRMAEYCQEVWDGFVSPRQILYIMQLAVLFGGYGIELVYRPDTQGNLRPVEYYPVHPTQFLTDREGNYTLLTRDQPVWGGPVAMNPQFVNIGGQKLMSLPIVPGKFIYHLHTKMTGPWTRTGEMAFQYFGRGENIPLYRLVMFDNKVTQGRGQFLEKYAIPPLILYYPNSDNTMGLTANIGTSMRGETVITLPRQPNQEKDGLYDIRALEVPKMGFDAFANFSTGYAWPGIKFILNGSPIIGQDTGSGLGNAEQETADFEILTQWDCLNVGDTIKKQFALNVCRQIPRWRNAPTRDMPNATVTMRRARTRLNELAILEKLNTATGVDRHNWYEAAGIQPPRKMTNKELNSAIEPDDLRGGREGGRLPDGKDKKVERAAKDESTMGNVSKDAQKFASSLSQYVDSFPVESRSFVKALAMQAG